jgi:hypothetical protein
MAPPPRGASPEGRRGPEQHGSAAPRRLAFSAPVPLVPGVAGAISTALKPERVSWLAISLRFALSVPTLPPGARARQHSPHWTLVTQSRLDTRVSIGPCLTRAARSHRSRRMGSAPARQLLAEGGRRRRRRRELVHPEEVLGAGRGVASAGRGRAGAALCGRSCRRHGPL